LQNLFTKEKSFKNLTSLYFANKIEKTWPKSNLQQIIICHSVCLSYRKLFFSFLYLSSWERVMDVQSVTIHEFEQKFFCTKHKTILFHQTQKLTKINVSCILYKKLFCQIVFKVFSKCFHFKTNKFAKTIQYFYFLNILFWKIKTKDLIRVGFEPTSIRITQQGHFISYILTKTKIFSFSFSFSFFQC
jgi:uncharacterized ubiquitin-like protein YukD